jgi:hypothetical protein
VKGLSLTQPWATLVAIAAKRIETRSWQASYRGLVAIHAAKAFPQDCQAQCYRDPFAEALVDAGLSRADALPRGAVIALARLLHIAPVETIDLSFFPTALALQERAFGDFSAGRFAWVLADVRRLPEPIPCKGALGLWTVPGDVAASIVAQLGRAA